MSRTFLPLCPVEQRFGRNKMKAPWFGQGEDIELKASGEFPSWLKGNEPD